MHRREFLVSVGATVVGLGGELHSPLASALAQLGERLGSSGRTPAVRHLGAAEVSTILTIADAIERRAHIVGGGAADNQDDASDEFESAMRTVDLVHRALTDDRSGQPDSDLYSAAGWLFRAVGFMAFDTSRITVAHELLWLAQECSTYAANTSLEARVLGTRARQDAWDPRGDPTAAAQLLVRALNLPYLSHTEQSMLHALQARALARLGMVQQTLRAVGESDDAMHLALSLKEDVRAERPWVGFFNLAHQQGDTGRALLDLAFSMGAPVPQSIIDDGIARHRRTLDEIDAEMHSRSATFTTLNLAATLLLAGAPDEALSTGQAGISLGAGVQSRRVDEHLRMLRDVCDHRCAGVRSAAELSEAVGLALVV